MVRTCRHMMPAAFAALLLLLMVGCDSRREPQTPDTQLHLGLLQSSGMDWQMAGRSGVARRAGEPIAMSTTAEAPATIGAFIAQGSTLSHTAWEQGEMHDRTEGTVLDYHYVGGADAAPEWKLGLTEAYAYAPYQLANVSMTAKSGALQTLTWQHIPSVVTEDHLLAYSKCSYDRDTGSVDNPYDHIPFRFMHTMARVRVMFQLSADFQRYRTIEIVDVRVKQPKERYKLTCTPSAYGWDTRYTDLTKSSMNWTKETADGVAAKVPVEREDYDFLRLPSPLSIEGAGHEGLWLYRTADADSAKYYYREAGHTTAYDYYEPWGSFYIAPVSKSIPDTLIVTYNVYDNQRLVARRQSTDKATFTLATSPSTSWTPTAGTCYNMLVTINPAWIFVLTDSD